MTVCNEPRYDPYNTFPGVVCTRESEHIGQHSAFPDGRLHVWSEKDGAIAYAKGNDISLTPCTLCGVQVGSKETTISAFSQEEYFRPGDEDMCFQCAFWSIRARNNKKYLVIDGRVYSWGHKSGYGGYEFTVRNNTTHEITQQRGLWDCGRVPLHLLPFFPETHSFITVENDTRFLSHN